LPSSANLRDIGRAPVEPRGEIGERHVEGRSRGARRVGLDREGRLGGEAVRHRIIRYRFGQPGAFAAPPPLPPFAAPPRRRRRSESRHHASVTLPVAGIGAADVDAVAEACHPAARRARAASRRDSSRSTPPGRPETTALTAIMPSATPSNRTTDSPAGRLKRGASRRSAHSPCSQPKVHCATSSLQRMSR
jgi:hypothetical protein